MCILLVRSRFCNLCWHLTAIIVVFYSFLHNFLKVFLNKKTAPDLPNQQLNSCWNNNFIKTKNKNAFSLFINVYISLLTWYLAWNRVIRLTNSILSTFQFFWLLKCQFQLLFCSFFGPPGAEIQVHFFNLGSLQLFLNI